MDESHPVKISIVAVLFLSLLAGCASQSPRQSAAEQAGPGLILVLPENSFDAERMFIRFNLARSLAVYQDCDFSVQSGAVRLGTPAAGADFETFGGRGRPAGSAEGLRIMLFDLAGMSPRPQPAGGGERREVVLHARELLTASGEPEQPAIMAVKKAALASGRSAGKIRLASLVHEGGGVFRAVAVLN
jgi:hypothetical protein